MAEKKKKKKRECPHGYKYGYDSGEYEDCGYCELDEKCQAKYGRLVDKGKIVLEDFGDEDEEPSEKKRKKGKNNKKKQDHRPILIPIEALDRLQSLSKPHNSNCIILYVFYLKEAVKQKTNQIWCNDSYVAGKYIAGRLAKGKERIGLKWDASRVAITKKLLIKLGFIKIIWPKNKSRDERGRFSKNYIKLKYFPSKMVIEKEEYLRQLDEYVEEFADWCNVFTSKINKLEVELWKCNKNRLKWKRRYLKLKKNV